MAVVGAASSQAFQTESVVTVKRQLQAEPDQGPAFCCNSCLGPKAISSWVRTGDLSVLNASISRQRRNPRLGRRWKLFRYSAFGDPAVLAELYNEDSEASAAEFFFTDDKCTSRPEASGLVEYETGRQISSAAWSDESCLTAQPQGESWIGLAPESRNPGEDAAAVHRQTDVYLSRDSPCGPVETVQHVAESPPIHLDGEWSDAGSNTEIPSDMQGTNFETDEKKELDSHRVYVGGLAFNFQGQELRKALRQLFSQFGPIRSLEVAVFGQDNTYVQENGRHRGFAYVVMEDPEDAKAAITCLNGQYYWGRNLMVRQAYKKVERKLPDRPCQLYVGNLNKTITNRELRKIFKRFGHVIQTKVIKEYISGKSRGFAFVTFAEEEEGKRAVQHLHGYVLGDSALVVNISKEPRIKGSDDVPTDAYSSVPSTEL